MKKILLILVMASFIGCTNEDGAKEFLEKQGYTNVVMTGHCYFGCSDDDNVSTGFEAINMNGVKVSGCVCEGLLGKNKTIRFD